MSTESSSLLAISPDLAADDDRKLYKTFEDVGGRRKASWKVFVDDKKQLVFASLSRDGSTYFPCVWIPPHDENAAHDEPSTWWWTWTRWLNWRSWLGVGGPEQSSGGHAHT